MKGISETIVYIVLVIVALALVILLIALSGKFSEIKLDEFIYKLGMIRRLG